jgi:hypothetical protein
MFESERTAALYWMESEHIAELSCILRMTAVTPYCTSVLQCKVPEVARNARVYLAKTGHGPHSSNCCVVLCIVCFVSFYVLFVCKCVLLPPGDNPIAVNKYISYHIADGRVARSGVHYRTVTITPHCILHVSTCHMSIVRCSPSLPI